MAMTPEGKVKREVVKRLAAMGAYYFAPQAGIYGRAGVPDIVGCYRGCFFAVECKAGKNQPTPLQEQALAQIRASGGIALWVNETTLDQLQELLACNE